MNKSFKLCKGKSHVYLSDAIRENKVSITLLDDNKKAKIAQQTSLFRYVRYDYFVSNVKNKTLTFTSPTCWDDPCDYLLYANPHIKIDGMPKVEIACLCTSYKSMKDEEPTWRLYGMDYVRIEMSFFKLVDYLEKIAEGAYPNEITFYITVIDYSKGKEGIKNIYKSYKNSYHSVEECLYFLSFKRAAFEYEREVRIFAVGKDLYKDSPQVYATTGMEYTNQLVRSIYLPPLKPIRYNDPRHDYYNKIQEAHNLGLKKRLKDLIPGCNVSQSGLYKL